jgi:solute:Na+ symporter, SSS family
VSGVVLVLAVALVTSSVDTLQHGLASLFAAERPAPSLRAARVLTVALMLPAVLVAAQGHSVLRLFLVADLVCAALVVPTFLGLWGRTTSRAAVAGAVAGLLAPVVPGWMASGSALAGLHLATFPGAAPTLAPFAAALGASTLVTLALSVVAPRRGEERPGTGRAVDAAGDGGAA